MTYKTYAVTTVVTDNELAKHLSWSSHLKGNYQKKQNVLHRKHEQNQTELNTVKPASWHQAQSTLHIYIYTYIYIYMHLKKLSWLFLAKTKHIGSPSQDSHKKRNRSRAEEADTWERSWGSQKKKRNGEWKGNKTGGKVEKMWSWGRLSKLDVDICEVSTCEAVRSALIRALVDSLPNKRFTALQLSKRNEPVCHVARSLLNTCALNKWKYL